MQVVVGYGLERCLAVGLGGAEVVAQLWSRSRRTTTRGSMMMKAWLQVSGWGSAILKARLRGIDDLEEVGAGVARRRVLTTLKAWPVRGKNHSRQWSEGFQRRRWSDDGYGEK